MKQIPTQLNTLYETQLNQKAIQKKLCPYYKKWLRYYLDFCHKYNHESSAKKSLAHYINKLKEKNQTDQQQKQAINAISLFYEIGTDHAGKEKPLKNKTNLILRKKEGLKESNASWVSVYDDLKNEIKLRHYSPNTLKTYRGWVRQFQNFSKSKDPRLLENSDVKKFLIYLAVDKKVAASTQNQSFNALLFFFKHILKRDFGEFKDVPRAKRKPYIPEVLSREEIDVIIANLSPLFH